MKKAIIALIMCLGACCLQAQNYYVATKTLNLRAESSTDSDILDKLSYCDNVIITEEPLNSDWVYISFGTKKGYVAKKYLKIGKCKKYTTSYRVGAVCRDGTRSSATGRGACSHHGGVSYWRTKTDVKYSIEDQ